MDCTNLAGTGLDLGPVLLLAAGILVAGFLLLFVVRGRHKLRAAALVTALLAFGFVISPLGGAPSAQAAADCSTDPGPANALTIVQTSTIAGLAPNVAPTAITGRVTNNSTDDTFLAEIVVSVLEVTKAPGAAPGTCDASDYLLVAPVMPVGQALAGGASTTFSGASIGFLDKSTNQDACQGATFTLLYTAS